MKRIESLNSYNSQNSRSRNTDSVGNSGVEKIKNATTNSKGDDWYDPETRDGHTVYLSVGNGTPCDLGRG